MYHYKPTYYSSHNIEKIVDGYVGLVMRHVNSGWTPYLLSFMFRHIYGKPDRVISQMESEIYWVYKGILRRSLKYPSTASKPIKCRSGSVALIGPPLKGRRAVSKTSP